MHQVLGNISENSSQVFFDDILVYSIDLSSHPVTLRKGKVPDFTKPFRVEVDARGIGAI